MKDGILRTYRSSCSQVVRRQSVLYLAGARQKHHGRQGIRSSSRIFGIKLGSNGKVQTILEYGVKPTVI